jgi:hypothetical protein
MSDGFLFDVSPVEDQDGKKRAKKPRKNKTEEAHPRGGIEYTEAGVFLATCIDGARCPLCDLPADLDVIDGPRWRLVCGWGCGYAWWQDARPSLIKTASDKACYEIKHGRWAGKTLSQVPIDIVEMMAEHGDLSEERDAAKKFLAGC